MENAVKQIGKSVPEIVTKGYQGGIKNARFFFDFLTELSINAGITNSQIAEENQALVTEIGPLNWDWVQAIVRTLDKRKRLAPIILISFTHDVYAYLTSTGIKTAVHDIIIREMTSEPCVVVGHSLGSLVSYNILSSKSDLNVCKFITIGSPLGMNAIKNLLASPLQIPKCLKNGWFNAFDDRDFVALNPLDEAHFNINPLF